MGIFSVAGDSFVMDGKPFRLLSGAVHYFRVVPEAGPPAQTARLRPEHR
jgi:beta-galactosidase GanA